MNSLPDLVDDTDTLAALSAVKIESHHKKKLRRFDFSTLWDGGSDIHGKNSDGIAAAAAIEQIASVIVRRTGQMLEFYGVQSEERDVFKAEKVFFESKRVFPPPQKINLDVLETAAHSIDSGDVVRPTCGISIPVEKFFEHISNRSLDSDSVEVEHIVFGDILADALQHGLRVLFSFCLIAKFDKCWNGRFMKEKIEDVRDNSVASFWRGFHIRYLKVSLIRLQRL
jgi:hypothetical protein